MAEVVRTEPPVLIENVSLVINVFNISPHGDVSSFPVGSPISGLPQPGGLLQQNGLIPSSTTTTLSCSSIDASGSLQKSLEPELCRKEATPLGRIAFLNGNVIPFGVQHTTLEIPSFGDRKQWKEIRVCLPPSLLADNETDLYCPVAACREKLPRNKSMDSHIKKHLGFTDKESQIPVGTSNVEGALPCPLFYYCYDTKCQYYVETAEKNFKAYKNVKQHYQKVHAPRLFECEQCQKTFTTQKVLETHKLMCGEKYSCSTCQVSYNTLESLQTHCRRKSHTYEYNKYKDRRNSVKQEKQSLKTNAATTTTPISVTPIPPPRKAIRKLPTLLPKGPTSASPEVLNSVQELCKQAGLKVDLGCQTVYTAFIQKSNPVEALVSPSTPSITQKKRKSTDTQTNIVKFRATCLDQKHNATNTNLDWKKVITSDSQTQTADSCDTVELNAVKPTQTDSSVQFNDEFATFTISESTTSEIDSISNDSCTSTAATVLVSSNDDVSTLKEEPLLSPIEVQEQEGDTLSEKEDSSDNNRKPSSPTIKVDNGPSLHSEFISFLEATDSATQTDPEMFDVLSGSECLGIRGLFGDDLAGSAEDAHYVSVSSTASQTAVENVTSKSLSAEDYEALLNTTDDTRVIDLTAFTEYIKTVEGINLNNNNIVNQSGSAIEGGGVSGQGTNDFLYDWEHIVEEVYRDVGD